MERFKTLEEAQQAAQIFFITNFDYYDGVGIEKKSGNVVEFYSKDDPAMDDTFTCIVESENE